jgi:integrase
MGRKRVTAVSLPKHVHVVKRPSGAVSYYYQEYRNTPNEGPRIRLPADPTSPEFWRAIEKAIRGAESGAMSRMIDAYLASPKFGEKAASTQKEYSRYLAEVRDLWGDLDPRLLRPQHVAELRDKHGKTPAKANNLIATIAALYAWGRQRGFANENPADGIDRLEVGEYHPWTDDVWKIAMQSLRSELRLACIFALYTGQRLGDVLAMKLGDIRDNIITVKQAKTGKSLHIPLTAELKPIVAECRKRGAIYLISKPDGAPLNVDDFHAMWGREMRKEPQATIRQGGFVFHGLRKNACNNLLEASCTSKEVAAITGHSLAMVEHYAKEADQLRLAKSAISKLEGTHQKQDL